MTTKSPNKTKMKAKLTKREQLIIAHSDRFRAVANRYPRRVAEAYDCDIARSARDTNEQVAATVARWEREHGLRPRNWPAIGRAEGRGTDDP